LRLKARLNYAKNRVTINKRASIFKKLNRQAFNFRESIRRAAKIQRTPKWLTEQELELIAGFYAESKLREKETGIKFNVDHIVPLQGKTVCGLHVPWNLQVITAYDNLVKGNRLL